MSSVDDRNRRAVELAFPLGSFVRVVQLTGRGDIDRAHPLGAVRKVIAYDECLGATRLLVENCGGWVLMVCDVEPCNPRSRGTTSWFCDDHMKTEATPVDFCPQCLANGSFRDGYNAALDATLRNPAICEVVEYSASAPPLVHNRFVGPECEASARAVLENLREWSPKMAERMTLVTYFKAPPKLPT